MAKPDPQMSSSVRSGSAARNSACQAGVLRDTARLAGACPPDAQEPDPVESAAREIIQGDVIDVGEGDRLAGLLRQSAQPDPRIDLHTTTDSVHAPLLVMQLRDHVGDQGTPAGLMRGPQAATGIAVVVFVEQEVVLEVRIGLQLLVTAEDGTSSVPVAPKDVDQAAAQLVSDSPSAIASLRIRRGTRLETGRRRICRTCSGSR